MLKVGTTILRSLFHRLPRARNMFTSGAVSGLADIANSCKNCIGLVMLLSYYSLIFDRSCMREFYPEYLPYTFTCFSLVCIVHVYVYITAVGRSSKAGLTDIQNPRKRLGSNFLHMLYYKFRKEMAGPCPPPPPPVPTALYKGHLPSNNARRNRLSSGAKMFIPMSEKV